MAEEIKNAKITNVSLTMENYGWITFWLTLDDGSLGCRFGGYCIGYSSIGYEPKEFTASGKGLVAMMRIMDTVGVHRWEDLNGRWVRCKVDDPGGRIDEIGNIVDEKWFNIREFFEYSE